MKLGGAFNRGCTKLMPKQHGTCATEASERPYSFSTVPLLWMYRT